MQIIWEITGYYERLTNDRETVLPTSLENLFTDFRAIATHQKRHHLPAVHQSFGLDFLPVNSVTHLMQQTLGRSPLLADQTLRPFIQNPSNLTSQQFRYQFITTQLSKNFAINLASDDSQIPQDFGDRYTGIYSIELKNTSSSTIQSIRTEAKNSLIQFVRDEQIEVINLALRSQNTELFSIPLAKSCTAWIKLTELHQNLQQAIKILRNKLDNIAITEPVQKLINDYRAKYPELVIISDRIPDLTTTKIKPKTEIKIGKGKDIHRKMLQEIIANAQKFLLICSYRLEDREILKMIVQKSQQIPIWILTDFSKEVQDRVDDNMKGQREVNPGYVNSDLKKEDCLRMLSKAGVGFRSGNFHLKTYISEQFAYLGSCNLTGGSLERNGEAGMLWQNTPEHQFLIDYFRYLWTHETIAQAIPSPIGFRNESLKNSIGSRPLNDRLLDHHAFKNDLSNSLKRFTGQKIHIYTRNFHPLSSQLNLLSNPRNPIFYGNYNNTNLRSTKIPNLHAKIIIIGSQVAYIGSQDLAFRHNSLIELTYKTTDSEEIKIITQQIQNLH